MTVTTTISSKTFQGNNTAKAFPCGFQIFQSTDVQVFFVNPSTGTSTPARLNTDYSLSGVGNSNGFTVNTTNPVPVGTNLYVERVLPLTQLTDFTNQGEFFPTLHQAAIDRLCMLIQQVANVAGLTLSLPPGLYPEPSNMLPAPSPSQLLGWNPAANALENYPIPDFGTGTYAPGFSGAVASRTIASKLRETPSTADFGCAGDGVTDDTTAFQNAVNSGAGTIRVVGTVLVKSTIMLPGDVTIVLPVGTAVKWGGAANGTLLETTSTGTIFNLRLLCQGGKFDMTGCAVGLRLHSVQWSEFDWESVDSNNNQTSVVIKSIADGSENTGEIVFHRIEHSGDCGTLLYNAGLDDGHGNLINGNTLVRYGMIRNLTGSCYVSGIEAVVWCDTHSFDGMVSLDLQNGAKGLYFHDSGSVYNHQFGNVNIAFYGTPSGRVGVYLGNSTRWITVQNMFIDALNTSGGQAEVDAGTIVDNGCTCCRVTAMSAVGANSNQQYTYGVGYQLRNTNFVYGAPFQLADATATSIAVPAYGAIIAYNSNDGDFTGLFYVLPAASGGGCFTIAGNTTYVVFGVGNLSNGGGTAGRLNFNAGTDGKLYISNRLGNAVNLTLTVLGGLERLPA